MELLQKNKNHQIKGEVSLSGDEVLIPRLNYKKEKGAQASMSFDIDFIIDKYYRISELAYQDLILGSSNPPAYGLELQNVKLNNQFELISLNNVYVKTYSDPKGLFLNNDFSIKMTDKLTINGNVFDARPLLKSLYKKNVSPSPVVCNDLPGERDVWVSKHVFLDWADANRLFHGLS